MLSVDRRIEINWIAGTQSSGYGSIGLHGKTYLAHRISYMINYGEIPDGLQVRHLCHNKRCVNPNHLEIGSAKDNIDDNVQYSRQAKGESHGRAKLSDEEVLEIRNLYGLGQYSCRDLARLYRLSSGYISQLIRGEYRNLPLVE